MIKETGNGSKHTMAVDQRVIMCMDSMKIRFKVRPKYGRVIKTLREIRGLERRMKGKSRGKLAIKEHMPRSGFWTWPFIYFSSYNSHNKVFILHKMKLRLREVKYFAEMKTAEHMDPQAHNLSVRFL